MNSIPALVESDLEITIEGEFGLPVILKNPNDILIDETVDGRPLKGFVRRSYFDTRDQRGANDRTLINSPVVKLRLSSLPEIPTTGANWFIAIPEGPQDGAAMEWFFLDPNKPVEINRDKGTVKLFIVKVKP